MEIDLDATPPVMTASANPTSLWPPKGKMVPVTVTVPLSNAMSGLASPMSYTTVDSYGMVQPSGTVTINGNGTYSFVVMLQAQRKRTDPNGRTYTVRMQERDMAGNLATAQVVVTVPHNQGTGAVVMAMSASAAQGPSGPSVALAPAVSGLTVTGAATSTAEIAAPKGPLARTRFAARWRSQLRSSPRPATTARQAMVLKTFPPFAALARYGLDRALRSSESRIGTGARPVPAYQGETTDAASAPSE
jgi:hypothetical protein